VVEFAPGGAKFMHRTETLDYAICLKGECDLELDDGRTVQMKAGEPVEKGGKKLTTHLPDALTES
jgi:quercetin dioxygenase-like cupin family protein